MASGDTLIIFTPLHNQPPAVSLATLDVRGQHPVLDFDDTVDEHAIFGAIMPRNYANSGVTVYLHYAMTSATSGNVVWNVAFERIGDEIQDIDGEGFAAANAVADAVPSVSGKVAVASIAFTDGADMDSVAVGEAFCLKVTRDADNAGDTASGDAELLRVEVKET